MFGALGGGASCAVATNHVITPATTATAKPPRTIGRINADSSLAKDVPKHRMDHPKALRIEVHAC
jgi:hypothetical protein